ncbi:MAG: sterol desaturase family protein [Steroidobacteraceae bacterium]|nr:sterol desaturase family protein [Steroidobacteraceae bacterium]MDW8259606.1 sterol desaturase family protein [Gammaproteobacteria bacterium]
MYVQLKELVRDWFGPLYEPLVALAFVLFPFTGPHVLNGVFVASAVVLALWFYVRHAGGRQPFSLREFWRFLAPREVFLHRSALVDYKFYVLNSLLLRYLRVGTHVAAFVGVFQIADAVHSALIAIFGARAAATAPPAVVLVAYSFCMVVAVDFAKFFAHYLQHKVTILWEFHKVHHSAQVLTPITNFRLHPVDLLLEQLLAAALTGAVAGGFRYFYSDGLVEITVLNIGVIYFLYFLAANLRHSHIPLAFGYRTSHIFSSPYMHQIHHSCEQRHWDKNYALIFSFWDWLFGSLYIPREREQFRLGLPGGENTRFDSVWNLYAEPFVGAARAVLRRRPAVTTGNMQ